MVAKDYARGHWARGQKANRNLTPLPGPDDVDDEDDGLPDELIAELEELDELDWIDEQTAGGIPPGVQDEPSDDPPARKIPPPRTRTTQPTGRKRATVTTQRDVQAKIRMVLMPAGKMWEIRDQQCGGTFVQQEPEISAALAEIVCDSPDLLNWFTGPAGGYMKYFRLVMAVQPVLLMVWLHHIAHAERVPVDGQAPQQMQNYAA